MSATVTAEAIANYEDHGMPGPFVRISMGSVYADFTPEQAKLFGFQIFSLAQEAENHEQ